MERLNILASVLFSLFLFFLLPAATGAVPGDWYGNVTIGSNTSTNGAIVDAYVNGSSTSAATAAVGQYSSGYYLIHVTASNGDNVTFKVYGVAAYPTNTTPQTWSVGNHAQLDLAMSTLANGQACTYNLGCSGSFCVHNVCRSSSTYCGDGYCDTGESCSADNSACASGSACTNGCVATSSSSSGGGGGGGTGSVSETTTILSITAGKQASVTFSKDVGVQQIDFEVLNTVKDVSVSVEKLTGKPADVPAPADNVFSYLKITVTNMGSSDLSKATISFKVPKSWLAANGIDKETVTLNRYSSSQWAPLPTTVSSEDDSYVYFKAITPGFSVFAITGGKVVQPQQPQPACTPGSKQCSGSSLMACSNGDWAVSEECQYGCNSYTLSCNPAPQPTETPQQQPSGQQRGSLLTVVLVVAAIFVVIVLIEKRRSGRKTKRLRLK